LGKEEVESRKQLPQLVQEVVKNYEPYRKIKTDAMKQKHVYTPLKDLKQRILVADDMKFVVVAMKALLSNVFKLDSDVVTFVKDG